MIIPICRYVLGIRIGSLADSNRERVSGTTLDGFRNGPLAPIAHVMIRSTMKFIIIVVITSCAPKRAFRYPEKAAKSAPDIAPVSYTHLRAHETRHDIVCRLLLEK